MVFPGQTAVPRRSWWITDGGYRNSKEHIPQKGCCCPEGSSDRPCSQRSRTHRPSTCHTCTRKGPRTPSRNVAETSPEARCTLIWPAIQSTSHPQETDWAGNL